MAYTVAYPQKSTKNLKEVSEMIPPALDIVIRECADLKLAVETELQGAVHTKDSSGPFYTHSDQPPDSDGSGRVSRCYR